MDDLLVDWRPTETTTIDVKLDLIVIQDKFKRSCKMQLCEFAGHICEHAF